MAIRPASALLPTTQVWDVASLQDMNVNSPEFKELLIRMYQNINAIVLSVNDKDTGMYQLFDFITGQLYYPNPTIVAGSVPQNRQVIRKVINFGALPNATTKSVAHGINVNVKTTFVHIYATANKPGVSALPIPYFSATASHGVEINVDATNVNITTGIDQTAYTICNVVVEYLIS